MSVAMIGRSLERRSRRSCGRHRHRGGGRILTTEETVMLMLEDSTWQSCAEQGMEFL